MKKLLPLLAFLLFITFSCEYDGTPRPDDETGDDDTTYTVNEASDGSIASGVSGNFPTFMNENAADHILTTGRESQTGLYEISKKIHRIDLTFPGSNWAQTLTAYGELDEELPATFSYDGSPLTFKVGVSYKGSAGAEDGTSAKRSFDISIDYGSSTQVLGGYYTIVLNNENQDKSFLRDALYRNCISKYIPAVQVNFVNLHINGEDYGLYANNEHINAKFLQEWFLSSNGTRLRAEPDEKGAGTTAGEYGTGFSGLNYLGDEESAYKPYYDIKKSNKENAYEDIVKVARILAKSEPDSLERDINKVLDLDRTLWFLACENIFTDEDSYVNKGGTDYYLYWEVETGRLVPLEYDGKDTFKSGNIQWDPFYHADDVRFPLINKLLAVPSIRQRYLAHYRTILKETFNLDYLGPKIDAYAAIIDSSIKADPKKLMTYDEFKSAVTELKSIISQRSQFLQAHDSVAVEGLTISDVCWKTGTVKWGEPTSADSVKVEAKISGGGVSSAYLNAATGMLGGFKRLQMFDDGKHGDDKAGDKIYTAVIKPQQSGLRVRFYIEAVRGNTSRTRSYSPPGAEHDVYTYIVK